MTEGREKDRLDTIAWTTRRANRVQDKMFLVSVELSVYSVRLKLAYVSPYCSCSALNLFLLWVSFDPAILFTYILMIVFCDLFIVK